VENRNTWIANKHDFLFRKILADPMLAEQWVDTDTKSIKQALLNEYG
jgi:hypothetical protein